MPDLITLVDVKDHLGIAQTDTSGDAELTTMIGATTDIIAAITGGPAWISPVLGERVRAEAAGTVLALRRRPVVDVTAIVNVASGEQMDLGGLDIDGDHGIVRRVLGWPFVYWYTPVFRVDYTAGWAPEGGTLPSGFNEAGRVIVAHMWETRRGVLTAVATPEEPVVPGYAFAVPNRALEILRPYTLEAFV